MPKIVDIDKWKAELSLAEDFREKEFGTYSSKDTSSAGLNIDYFERGHQYFETDEGVELDNLIVTTLNLYHAITKNIVPSLYFQNPKVLCFPKKIESQTTAPIVGETVNYFYRELEVDDVNQKVVWDAYVLGVGVSKVGYACKYGMDTLEEKKQVSPVNRLLEKIGLKKTKEVETTNPEINYKIESESPYVKYVSPFDFGIDPRAKNIDEAMYVYEKFKKTLAQVKANKKYKNTSKLVGSDVELDIPSGRDTDPTQMDDFKTVDIYEVHYRQPDGVYHLVLAKDRDEWAELYNERSPYEMRGWQYEILVFNKHPHKLYPISDMTKIRALQDRITSTIDAVLDQVDRFHPKIAVNGTDVTPEGKLALRDGDIGAIVDCTKNPSEVFKELSFTQVKADLRALIDQMIDIITIQTGLTRAQLTGMSSSGSATEATIEQGGQTLRLSDMGKEVGKYSKKQARKLWEVIKQFVDIETLQLINGVSGIDEQTGIPKYNWLEVNEESGAQMRSGEYDFDIEVGSTQKPDLAVIRKQFEGLFNILARTDVITLMQQQGKKVDLAELLRLYLQLFPELVRDIGKIIQVVTPQTSGLVPPMVPEQRGGTTSGSNHNALEAQRAQPVPTMAGMGNSY